MAQNIVELKDASFEEKVLKADKLVLVDFWAAWCGPCKAIAPIIDALEKIYGEKMIFAKVNVDENPISPSRYGVQAIPTLIFFKNGQIAKQITGLAPQEQLEEVIKELL